MLNRFERFIFTISEIDKNWHKVASDVMAEYGLKGPLVVYIVALNRNSEGVTASQLGEICGRNKADVSRAMKDMESKGLVKRGNTSSNLYRAKLTLTEKGKAAAERVIKAAARAVEFGGKGIDDEKREIFYEILGMISSNLKEMSKKGLDQE